MSASSTLGRTGLLLLALAAVAPPAAAQQWEVPLTEYGHPDLQGNWINATLTPLERSPGLEPVYTRAEVEAIEQREEARVARGYEPSDPDRPPPEAGNLGAYNQVYLDRGDQIAVVNGEPRTSLITFPPDGRMPPLTPEGQARKEAYEAFQAQFGAYDHPELRPPAERCVVYYGSSDTGVLGTPMTPTNGYNNNFTIVQNEDHVLIHAEMIHDVRIVRLGEPGTRADARAPLPADQRPWFGESWGRWEGETLVVETTQVHPLQGIRRDGWIMHSERLRMIERFTRVDEETILYEFTVDDPGTYTEPWGGQIPWRRFDDQIYEYGCHEGNYALSNILSGARYQERVATGREP
jgi:hypothetical protein